MRYPTFFTVLFSVLALNKGFGQNQPFITSWQIEVNDTIIIPLQSGTYNFDFTWTLTTDNSVQISGTHANADGDFETAFIDAGTYELAIIGDFPHLRNYPKSKLLDVLQWGDIVWGNMTSMFSNWKGTGFSATDAPDMSQVTNMNNMFTNATNFNEDLNHWDVSNVRAVTSIFEQARAFNGDITNWNVSKVTNFRRTFDNAVRFNQDISDWDLSSATTVEKMFENADAFNQPIGKWDVSNVTQFRRMLPGMANFNQSLDNWKFKQDANINFSQFASGTNSMSCENYSSTLLGWNFNNPTLENINLEGFNANYNSL
ncbi:MAG: BspA family leucine-rich repeat surface protein, partial [Bacteroidota bacterium]